jgi:hypothetical protein
MVNTHPYTAKQHGMIAAQRPLPSHLSTFVHTDVAKQTLFTRSKSVPESSPHEEGVRILRESSSKPTLEGGE